MQNELDGFGGQENVMKLLDLASKCRPPGFRTPSPLLIEFTSRLSREDALLKAVFKIWSDRVYEMIRLAPHPPVNVPLESHLQHGTYFRTLAFWKCKFQFNLR